MRWIEMCTLFVVYQGSVINPELDFTELVDTGTLSTWSTQLIQESSAWRHRCTEQSLILWCLEL